jgi:hypothetical protein
MGSRLAGHRADDSLSLREEILPPEIMLLIFSLLPGKDVLTSAALASRYFYSLTLDEQLWRALCARDVDNISLLKLLQPDAWKKGKDYSPADLALISSRDAFIHSKPQDVSWQWLWRAQNARSPVVKSHPSSVKSDKKVPAFTGIGFGTSDGSSSRGRGDTETKVWEYCGEWKDGQRHGYGTCIWNNGTWYQGRWENDTRQGFGKIAWKGGGYYEGEWKEGFQDGDGTLHTRNGFTFKGIWTRNELNGRGIKSWFEQGKLEVYEGDFKQTKAHGHGCRRYGSGATYEGLYDGDRRVGHGVYTWPCGHQFVGEWQVGRRKGRLICPDGREFEQVWKEEKMQESALHAPDQVLVVSLQQRS